MNQLEMHSYQMDALKGYVSEDQQALFKDDMTYLAGKLREIGEPELAQRFEATPSYRNRGEEFEPDWTLAREILAKLQAAPDAQP